MKSLKINANATKIAFCNSNREVSSNKELFNNIQENGVLVPIIVINGSDLMEEDLYAVNKNGKIGKKLKDEEKPDYLVVLDGQHRLVSLLKILNVSKKGHGKKCTEEINVNLITKEEMGDDMNQYIININSTSKKWSNSNYIDNAYKQDSDDKLLRTIKAFDNLKFPLSTISGFICFNRSSITAKAINAYTKENAKIPYANWEKAIRLYLFLKDKGFKDGFLKKRIMIDFIIEEVKHHHINVVLGKLHSLSKDKVQSINELTTEGNSEKRISNIVGIDDKTEETGTKDEKDYLKEISEDKVEGFLKGDDAESEEKESVVKSSSEKDGKNSTVKKSDSESSALPSEEEESNSGVMPEGMALPQAAPPTQKSASYQFSSSYTY